MAIAVERIAIRLSVFSKVIGLLLGVTPTTFTDSKRFFISGMTWNAGA
jgi:hypothetical protein